MPRGGPRAGAGRPKGARNKTTITLTATRKKPHGGKRRGAGRKKGSRNKKTIALTAAIDASGLAPLDFMLAVMRDPNEHPDRRAAMAKAALPLVHRRIRRLKPKDAAPPVEVAWIERVIVDEAETADPPAPGPASSPL